MFNYYTDYNIILFTLMVYIYNFKKLKKFTYEISYLIKVVFHCYNMFITN